MAAAWNPPREALLAVITGLAAALLPLPVFAFLLGGGVMGVLFLIEPVLALVVMLSAAPLKTLIETESPIQLPVDIGQLTLMIFIGVWVLRRVADRKTQFRYPTWLLLAIGYFMLMASFSVWTAYSTPAFVTEMLKWGQLLLLVFIVANTERWRWALFGVVLSATLQAVIGLWEFAGGSGAAHLWILDYRYFRAFGTFGQPNPFGAFMGMVLPLALGTAAGYGWAWARAWMLDARPLYPHPKPLPHKRFRRGQEDECRGGDDSRLFSGRHRSLWSLVPAPTVRPSTENRGGAYTGGEKWLALLYGGMGAVILLGLLASWSRGAWLGFLGAVVVMMLFFPRKQSVGVLALGVGGGLFLLLWMGGVLPASLTARLTDFSRDFTGFGDVRGAVISDENFAVLERLAHWQAAIEMANTRPFTGVGFGNYETAYPDFALANWQNPLGHAHNYYFNVLAETGLIGFHSYLVMWGLIILQNWRLLRKPIPWQQRGILVGLLGVWTHITIHSLLDKLYVNNLFLHAGVMLGILAVLNQELVVEYDCDSNCESC